MGTSKLSARRIIDEHPLEFRTRKHHWVFYVRTGLIRIYNLKADPTGEKLIPSTCGFELDREELRWKPDLFRTLLSTLTIWAKE